MASIPSHACDQVIHSSSSGIERHDHAKRCPTACRFFARKYLNRYFRDTAQARAASSRHDEYHLLPYRCLARVVVLVRDRSLLINSRCFLVRDHYRLLWARSRVNDSGTAGCDVFRVLSRRHAIGMRSINCG